MMQTTIEVQYVNPPKIGKKMGSIKSTDGEYYSVWPDKLHTFQVGGSYTVEYEVVNTNSGTSFKSIKKILDQSGVLPLPTQSGPGPARVPSRGGSTTAEEMFVMGVIGRALQGSGTLPDPIQLKTWVRAARFGWREGFKEDTAPTTGMANELNDEIPF